MSKQASENEGTLEWSIHSKDLKIKESKVVRLPVSKLSPHPDNRPLGHSEEKVRQLKNLIAHDGFDSSHPLVVRPHSQGYQIIEGEHRFKAAKSLGYLELPCVVRDLTDTEALIQLVLGNIQTESRPLEIGLNALKVTQRDSYSISEYAKRLGLSDTSIRRYMNASEVFQFIKTQLPEGTPVLDEVHKLEEIHRLPQSDWLWFYNLIMKFELSKNQVIEVSQAIREIKTDQADIYNLFDFVPLRQEIAQEITQGNRDIADRYKDLIRTVESSYEKLDQVVLLYEYNVLNDEVQSEENNLRDWFIGSLKDIKPLTKQQVLEVYKDALQLKRSGSKEEAERAASYFRDKKNAKEREEQERIERAMRQVKEGEWWQLGNHYLYCGDGSQREFYEKLPKQIALAYCNPTHITEVKLTDNRVAWRLDWLIEKADVVAVAPPIDQIQKLLQTSQMPYKWSMASQLVLKKDNTGLGSWIYTALFSEKNIDPRVRDSWEVDSSDLKGGRKTEDFLQHLLVSFSREQEVVVDTFAGLGVMFLVAEDMTRVCYGAETNPSLCKEIIEKWEELSGEKARKYHGEPT